MLCGMPLNRLPSYPLVSVMTSARLEPATTSVCAQVLEMPPSMQNRWPSNVGPITPGSDELAAAACANGMLFLRYDQPLARVAVVGGGVHLCHRPAGCAVAGQPWPIARIEAGLPSLTLK